MKESLTNVLKHAHARRADVEIEYDTGQLRIEVRDDGRGPVARDDHGHGLLGIGERVKIYGGDMPAGAGEVGGFVLRALLPVDGVLR